MSDNGYERSADMRLLELQRSALNLSPLPVRSKNYIDFDPFSDSASEDEAEGHVPHGAIVVATLDAQPRRALIAGAVVTISLSIANDGDLAAQGVYVILPLPADAVLRPEGCIIDGGSRPGADDLVTTGIELGDIAPHTVRTIIVKIGIEAGLGDVIVSGQLRAKLGAILGPRTLRLTRGAPAPLSLVPERPFYESDSDESEAFEESPGRRHAISVVQPREFPPVAPAVKSTVDARATEPVGVDSIDPEPSAAERELPPPPPQSRPAATLAVTAPETIKALVRSAMSQRESEAEQPVPRAASLASGMPDQSDRSGEHTSPPAESELATAAPLTSAVPRPPEPVILRSPEQPQPALPHPQTPELARSKPAEPVKPARRPARPTSLFPETISALVGGVPDSRVAAGPDAQRVSPIDKAARKALAKASKKAPKADQTGTPPSAERRELPSEDSAAASVDVPTAPQAVEPTPLAAPVAPIVSTPPPAAAPPAKIQPSIAAATLVAVPAVQRKLEVVRSPDERIWVEGRDGPIMVVSIDRKRLATLTGLFSGPSLGMIAHYLVLNALAAKDPLPMDGPAPAIATFVARQEQLLSRALIATRLGKTPAPQSLSADLPPFPPPLPVRTERCVLEPAAGQTLLVRAFGRSDIAFLVRMLANDSAAPFLRAAQLFVGLCANDAALSDSVERKALSSALSAYAALATAEISRIFLRSRLQSAPVIFKVSDAALDDAARRVLAALGRPTE